MSFTTAINSIKTLIESVSISGGSLVYTTDSRQRELKEAGRAKFDASYLIRSEGGGSLFRELAKNPSAFVDTITLQIGTEMTTDALTADETSVLRGQKILESLLTSDMTDVIDIQPTSEPSKFSDDRRIVWSQKFRLIYLE